MKNRLLVVVIASLAIVGCRKEPEIDPYMSFKSDATLRWEKGLTRQASDSCTNTFINDAGGILFDSPKYKIGRIIKNDGSDYEIIEFSGTPAIGKPAEPSLRKPSGTINLHSLEIVKIDDSKLWIVFQETDTSLVRMVVQ